MNQNNHQITADEAKAALESLNAAKKVAVNSQRPPKWLIFLSSLFLGIETLSAGFSSGSSLWTFVMIVSTIALLISIGSWFIVLRTKGITVKFIGVSKAEKTLGIISGILVGLIIIASQTLYHMGYNWFPYVAAIANSLILAFTIYFCPAMEWITKEAKK